MKTYVVNIKFGDKYDVFIGRGSCWGNPYHIGQDGNREEVIEKYRKWIMERPELIKRAKEELKGKCLGCYCSPNKCHGDVLVKISEEE